MDLRVVVVEDDEHYRLSMETLLGLEPGFELAGSYASARAFLEALAARPPGSETPWDVVLMDIDLPGIDGIEATERLKGSLPRLPVVILTAFEDTERILGAIRAGADGYLLKRAGVTDVIEQLRSVAEGGSPMTPTIAHAVLELMREREGGRAGAPPRARPVDARTVPMDGADGAHGTAEAGGERLSERERAVLTGLVNGRSYKQIASDLDLSTHTIRTYLRRVYAKLRVHSATEAVARALRGHLTD